MSAHFLAAACGVTKAEPSPLRRWRGLTFGYCVPRRVVLTYFRDANEICCFLLPEFKDLQEYANSSTIGILRSVCSGSTADRWNDILFSEPPPPLTKFHLPRTTRVQRQGQSPPTPRVSYSVSLCWGHFMLKIIGCHQRIQASDGFRRLPPAPSYLRMYIHTSSDSWVFSDLFGWVTAACSLYPRRVT